MAAIPDTVRVAWAGRAARARSLEKKRTRWAWIFLIPSLIVVAFVALYPLAQTFYLSFTNTRLFSGEPPSVVGLRNYVDLLRDAYFLNAVKVTVSFTVATVLLEFLLGLLIGLV